jgi:hypothetical protein
MDLKNDKRQNIQIELDFSSATLGEAQVKGRKEAESLMTAHGNERPASTSFAVWEVLVPTS